MYTDYTDSPLGIIEIKASEQEVTQIIFSEIKEESIKTNTITKNCKKQLKEYFMGKRRIFDIPLKPQGTTFQKLVWKCLAKIPFGETFSYLDVANEINHYKAVRAVGNANHRNPISILIPCHRVIGSNGALTGYAGGIERKHWLLEHEGNRIKS